MLKLVKGCRVTNAHLLSEQYQIKENGITANVNADKIEKVFLHFIAMQEERLFFFLELPSKSDVEEKLRKTSYDPMHIDVYYMDNLSMDEAFALMERYGSILINDGLSRFGFCVQDNSAELKLGKYNVVSLWTNKMEKYRDFFGLHNIPKVDKCLTAWETLSENAPGECSLITTNGRTVFDLVEDLADWGIYFAERREDY